MWLMRTNSDSLPGAPLRRQAYLSSDHTPLSTSCSTMTLNPNERYPSATNLSAPYRGEPTDAEIESKRLAQLLQYGMESLDQSVSDWIADAARSERGDIDQIETIVHLLTDLCANLSDTERRFVLGNGRNPHARALADWWKGVQSGDQAVS